MRKREENTDWRREEKRGELMSKKRKTRCGRDDGREVEQANGQQAGRQVGNRSHSQVRVGGEAR